MLSPVLRYDSSIRFTASITSIELLQDVVDM